MSSHGLHTLSPSIPLATLSTPMVVKSLAFFLASKVVLPGLPLTSTSRMLPLGDAPRVAFDHGQELNVL